MNEITPDIYLDSRAADPYQSGGLRSGSAVCRATEAAAGEAPEVDAARFTKLDAFLSGLPEGFLAMKPADINLALGEADKPFMLDVREAEQLPKDGAIARMALLMTGYTDVVNMGGGIGARAAAELPLVK